MITVERTFVVARPAAKVFAYLSDFTATEQWDPGTVTTVRTDDGPLQVGSTFHNVSQYRGRRTELDYRLVTFEPERHLVFTGVNKTVEASDDLTFTATGENETTIRYQARFRFQGIARLAEPFLRRGFEPIADETVEQLTRTLLERL